MSAAVILLVDDDPDFLEMNRHVLEAKGYKAVCLSDGPAALERMKKEPPDIVVTDLMMTSLDSGFSLARQMKQDPRLSAVPIIIVTAVAAKMGFDFRPRTSEDLAAMGARAFFEKPVSPEVLVQKIQELLKEKAAPTKTEESSS